MTAKNLREAIPNLNDWRAAIAKTWQPSKRYPSPMQDLEKQLELI